MQQVLLPGLAFLLGHLLGYPGRALLGLVAGYLLLPELVVAVPVHPDLGAGELLALLWPERVVAVPVHPDL